MTNTMKGTVTGTLTGHGGTRALRATVVTACGVTAVIAAAALWVLLAGLWLGPHPATAAVHRPTPAAADTGGPAGSAQPSAASRSLIPVSPAPSASGAPSSTLLGSPAAPPRPLSRGPSIPTPPIPSPPIPVPPPGPPSPGSPGPGSPGFPAPGEPGLSPFAPDGWLQGLVTSGLDPVLQMFGALLASPRVDEIAEVRRLWQTSTVIANTCFVLLVLAGGLIVMGHGTVQSNYTAQQVAPRLVVGMVAANLSLPLIGTAIEFGNGLSTAILGEGVTPDEAADSLKDILRPAVAGGRSGITIILTLVAVIMLIILAVIYLVRVMLLTLLVAAAPLALACHALPHTDNLAKAWWRALAGVLAIPIAQALVATAAIRVFFTPSRDEVFVVRGVRQILDLLLVICLLYILIRIPSWISRMIFRGGGRSPLIRIASTIAKVLIFRGLLGKSPLGKSGGKGGKRQPPARPRPGGVSRPGRPSGSS